ncbi:glutamine--fructose-6-phosphate transaminase (isomerizing) [Rugosimonospora africana]|uniref:Glutamine--fructose-6-phosphate aminotransferase [isomerizing] n=1 Tax=Rugosimonospora africana TaxID=556532 RepID=A0A8J3QJK9_9ACTN|nr:glutamine--fructose-6-phosphate transaminase (isomerizing) [Rugosimonospora africana]GIH12183.1 glutamine--fructose-6-phosphate aminotransferase [isomerizing] [Rugosimonospora africana]
MCGIVGYTGARSALGIVLDGLRRLEYRGYDSAGVAVVADGELLVCKRAGKLSNLEKALMERADWHAPEGAPVDQPLTSGETPAGEPVLSRQEASGKDAATPLGISGGTTAIGHTRWATHGGPTDRNAHPHLSSDCRVGVIHNGIIENFAQLRDELEGCDVEFASDTDTECVAHLLCRELEKPDVADLSEAMRRVCQRLEGAFTLLAVDANAPGVVVGARRNSPLVVGRGAGENYLASDVSAFIEHTREAIELGQDQIVMITPDEIVITDFAGNTTTGKDFHIDWDASAAEKGGYDYFMLKEIAEQPQAVAETLIGRLTDAGEIMLDEVRLTDQDLRDIDKVFIVACGTAYHAGMVAKYAIEHWTRLPCEVELASEFRYRDPVLDRSTLVVAISQSGETMDTLMALRHAKEQKARVLAICNTNGSTIPRESDGVLYTHAGPEIAVASTKAFLTQLVACYLVGLHLSQVRGIKYADEVGAVVAQLQAMPSKVEEVLTTMEPVRELARELANSRSVLFIGRHVGYPVALEGALKLKELAYMHAEGFAAGELKHGPIALIDEGTPVVCVVPSPAGRGVLHDKIVSNIQEIRARGARTIVIAEEGDEAVLPYADDLVRVPRTPTLLAPLVTTVPLQVLACEIAASRGHDVDQPRNLAKSVTVE